MRWFHCLSVEVFLIVLSSLLRSFSYGRCFPSFVFLVYGFSNKAKLLHNVKPFSENSLTVHGLKIVVKVLPNFLSCLYPCFYQFLSIITLFPSFTFVEYIAKDQINEIDQSLSKSKNKREIRNFHFPSALSKRKKIQMKIGSVMPKNFVKRVI